MAPRRGSTRGRTTAPNTRRRTQAGVRKNTRNRQAPNRYGQEATASPGTQGTQEPHSPTSSDAETEPTTSRYSHSPDPTPSQTLRGTSTLPSEASTLSSATASPEIPIDLNTMRELLRSHEQDIVERVVQQLSARNQPLQIPSPPCPRELPRRVAPTHPPTQSATLGKIAELERQLAQLREESEQERATMEELRAPGTYNLCPPSITHPSESASGIADSVEVLFPGVERSTLVQIIENRFKPTNIYRLLASEKERAEEQRTICIGGIEFEQAEKDGKESEYRMGSFFKAWAAYCGILVKLAPHSLQGDLATALSIYTMNIYDLLEKYAWEGVKAYHFQFHRKRVASGKSIYHALEWRTLDSELIASKCFAHPAPRLSWSQSYKAGPTPTRKSHELSIRENAPGPAYPTGGAQPPAQQACRNWNHRECRNIQCRYQHACIYCGSNHRAPQCPTRNGDPGPISYQRPSRR